MVLHDNWFIRLQMFRNLPQRTNHSFSKLCAQAALIGSCYEQFMGHFYLWTFLRRVQCLWTDFLIGSWNRFTNVNPFCIHEPFQNLFMFHLSLCHVSDWQIHEPISHEPFCSWSHFCQMIHDCGPFCGPICSTVLLQKRTKFMNRFCELICQQIAVNMKRVLKWEAVGCKSCVAASFWKGGMGLCGAKVCTDAGHIAVLADRQGNSAHSSLCSLLSSGSQSSQWQKLATLAMTPAIRPAVKSEIEKKEACIMMTKLSKGWSMSCETVITTFRC